MIEQSQIYRGEVTHERFRPIKHKFTYPMTFFALHLGELTQISESSSLFGYNRSRPLRISDEDFLRGKKEPILTQLNEFIPSEDEDERTILVSSPRYFGYAFNPVNFYLRLKGDVLKYALAEVNNTFGDRHIYPLKHLEPEGRCTWAARCPKDFHVSPFNDMAGEYRFTFHIEQNQLFLGVDLWKNHSCVMKTWIKGRGHALDNRQISRYALLHPLDTAVNSMPRILWQAAVLYCRKKMKPYKRPAPRSEFTIKDRDKPHGYRDII